MNQIRQSDIFNGRSLTATEQPKAILRNPGNFLFVGEDIDDIKNHLRIASNTLEGTGFVSLYLDTDKLRYGLLNEGFEVLSSYISFEKRIDLYDAEKLSQDYPFTVINFIKDSDKEEYFSLKGNALYELSNVEEVIRDNLKIKAVINVVLSSDTLITEGDLAAATLSIAPYSDLLTSTSHNICSFIMNKESLTDGIIVAINKIATGLESNNVFLFNNGCLSSINVQEHSGRLEIRNLILPVYQLGK